MLDISWKDEVANEKVLEQITRRQIGWKLQMSGKHYRSICSFLWMGRVLDEVEGEGKGRGGRGLNGEGKRKIQRKLLKCAETMRKGEKIVCIL